MRTTLTNFLRSGKSAVRALRLFGATLLAGGLLTPALWTAVAAADPAITLYDTPTNGYPYDLTQGADGNAWFTYMYGDTIGRITPSGTITNYTVPTSGSDPFSITEGPDGKAWFTERAGGKIANIDTSGNVAEPITLPTGHSPTSIVTGPDGNLWFTENGSNKIGRMTTSGAVTQYAIPTANSEPYFITNGPDGAMWFGEYGGDNLGRITTTGTISEYPVNKTSADISGMQTFSDGTLWFAGNNYIIGRATFPPAAPVVQVTNPGAGSTVSGTVNITGTINSPANYNLMLYVFNSSGQAVVSRYQYNLAQSATTTSYSWDTTAVPNGNYTVILSAKDANGHKDNNSTSTVHITVQN